MSHFDSMLGLPRLESDCENLLTLSISCIHGLKKIRALAPSRVPRVPIRNRAIIHFLTLDVAACPRVQNVELAACLSSLYSFL